ncbi:MAG: hypothetical protein JKY65_10795 [Planctomycetes bacterium]|nr:hypothetical protein [Planctomycetota bacterium]
MNRRLPNAFVLILTWCIGLGGLSLWAARLSTEFEQSGILLAYGSVHLLLAVLLISLRPWARWVGLVGFALLAAAATGHLLLSGASWSRFGLLIFDLYSLIYLLAPSTRELFQGGRPTLSVLGAAPVLLLVGAAVVCGLGGVETPWTLGLLSSLVLAYSAGQGKAWRWLSANYAPPPLELAEGERVRFRAARQARYAGEWAQADALLEGLRKARGVRVLAGLTALDRARERSASLARIVFDSEYEPSQAEVSKITAACRDADLELLRSMVEERAELIDDLLDDAVAPRSCLFLELRPALTLLTGRHVTFNPEPAYRVWWREHGPRQRGDQALRWLVVRLWEAECFAAAEVVAAHVDPIYAEAAKSAQAFAELRERLGESGWLTERKITLALSAGIADSMGWLLLDGTLGRNAVQLAGLHERRRNLIQGLRLAWEAYPGGGGTAIPWLLHLLTDLPLRQVRWPRRFDRAWAARRLAVERYEGLLVAGARAAAEEMWEIAERTYAEAGRVLPERSAASYNRAFALMECGRHAQAEQLLLELARRESDEPFWWLRLGDCRRGQGDLRGALAAYHQVLEREGMGGRVALRVGLTLAADGKHDVAERFLDAAVEQIDDPEMIQRLAAVLESEGAYTLAQRYEERAFNDALERGDHEWRGDDSDDDAEAVR